VGWPSVSVVTPSFNQARFIGRTIDSVLSQGYPNLQYIVVDGGSTDGTLGILRSYGEHLEWISEPDRGQTDAINKGFRMATGDIVAWLNSDDTYQPGAIRAAAEAFVRSPDVAMVYGQCWMIDERDERIRPYDLRPYASTDVFDRLLNSDPSFIPQQTVFMSRAVVRNIGPLDDQLFMCMDYDYWLRISRSCPVIFVSRFIANFRIHSGAKSARHPWRSLMELSQIRAKYSPRLVSWFYPRQFYRLARALSSNGV
jgi:glycosyltransferase involved in cell wall biosynthesis